MSTLKVNKIENTSTTDGGIEVDTSGHVKIDGQQLPTAGPLSNRNMIINGAMQVAQRGTSLALPNATAAFVTDRFQAYEGTGGSITMSNSGQSPDDFTKSTKIQITSADTSLSSGQQAWVRHRIEGLNMAHLKWGSSAAKTITLSFWVRSSVTGNFSVSIQNGAGDRCWPYLYNIATADTWEYKTVTVPGETTGTWNTDNTVGMTIYWSFGMGSNLQGTSGTWNSSAIRSASGETELIGTNGALWYLTGVQLEVGSKSTPFEHRSYGDELARCQRYLFRVNRDPDNADEMAIGTGHVRDSDTCQIYVPLPVQMRANGQTITEAHLDIISGADNENVSLSSSFDESNSMVGINVDADSGTPFTVGRGALCRLRNVSGAFFQVESEL